MFALAVAELVQLDKRTMNKMQTIVHEREWV